MNGLKKIKFYKLHSVQFTKLRKSIFFKFTVTMSVRMTFEFDEDAIRHIKRIL